MLWCVFSITTILLFIVKKIGNEIRIIKLNFLTYLKLHFVKKVEINLKFLRLCLT